MNGKPPDYMKTAAFQAPPERLGKSRRVPRLQVGVVLASTGRRRGNQPNGYTTDPKQVLDFVKRYIQAHSTSPSVAEVAQALGIASGTAGYHLRQLRRDGLLTNVPGKVRTYRPRADLLQQPLYFVEKSSYDGTVQLLPEQPLDFAAARALLDKRCAEYHSPNHIFHASAALDDVTIRLLHGAAFVARLRLVEAQS